ncbi:class I SAM-dependent methyltransferase, partial [Candidatus Bathyarchaeota archaeon]|nr:class I SAM-dependent methyltransferase [Candidatus Bathyarchaeota archaeon]
MDLIYYTTIPSRLAALKLIRKANKVRRVDDLVELAFNYSFPFRFKGLTIKPAQVKEEITVLLRILKSLNLRRCLEIGTAGGGTLFLFAQASRPDALLISVDLPGGPFGGGYPAWKMPLYKSFTRYATQKIHLLRADSHDPSTLRRVKEILGDAPLDFLFIDGDHTYEGVKKDFEMYSPLVRKSGIIAFHDIVPGPPENVGGVPEF